MAAAEDPHLRGGPPQRRTATSAVLILHGGQEISAERTAPRQAAVLRMLDLYAGLRRHRSGAAIYLLRYRLRGWNADAAGDREPHPVTDARAALDLVAARHGDIPIALLGHSMGARTALAVADDVRVVGVCALAPWLPPAEPLPPPRPQLRVVLAHGTADRTTSAAGSLDYARRLRAAGGAVARFELEGGGHALLQSLRQWHRFAVAVSLGLVDDAPLPLAVAAAVAGTGDAGLRVPLGAALAG